MNDMVSPSQSSPSMMGNAGQKANTSGENAAMVRRIEIVFCLHWVGIEFFQLLTKPRLQELVREVDANEQLDGKVKLVKF